MAESTWKRIIERGGLGSLPLWLASLAYSAGFAVAKAVHRPKVRVSVPVISVGNITVGGAGKTPVVGWLIEELGRHGRRVGIVARGYKREGRAPLLATGADIRKLAAAQTGDEVKLLAHEHPHAVFSVDTSKWRAAQALAESGKVDFIVVDDGFQHWALHRDVDIVAVDASMNPALARRFPYGILREGFSALRRADIILITRANLGRNVAWVQEQINRVQATAPVFEARFIANDIHSSPVDRLPISYLRNRSVFLFAGIGHFAVLADQVRRLAGNVVGTMELADHQAYDEELCSKIREAAEKQNADLLLTTAKDWVKLGDFDFGRETYYLGLTVKVDRDRDLLDLIERKITRTRQGSEHGSTV